MTATPFAVIAPNWPGYVGSAAATRIALSNSYVDSAAAVSTVVGTLSVFGANGTPVYALDDDAGGKFQISGDELQVAAALSEQDYTVIVSVSGVSPTVRPKTFIIHAIAVGSPIGLLLALTKELP